MDLLGIRIDEVSLPQALEKVRVFLAQKEQKMIFTPNPEMVVEAQKDSYFKEILNKADLNICDGKGIQLVAKEKIHRIPGVDFLQDLCALAEKESKSIYLLGSGSEEVVQKCQEKLSVQFPHLKIAGGHPGIQIFPQKNEPSRIDYNQEQNDALLEHIILAAPDILFVGFGHGKQEKWIYENLPSLPSVKVAMGVGGSFDYISGKIRRAPKMVQRAGLEWVWRLLRQPSRFFRIWNATVRFLFLYFGHSKENA